MPHTEKQLLEEALRLPLTEATFDWSAFKAEYHIAHDTPEHDAADRAFFTWQHFRGAHTAQSCLLDDEGRVRGLIVKGTDLIALRIPALPALEYLCVCDNERLTTLTLTAADYPLLQYIDWSNNQLDQVELRASLPLLRYLNLRNNNMKKWAIAKENTLPALEELDLSNNRIKNWNAWLIDQVPKLQFLFLRNNPLNESVTAYRNEQEGNNYLRSLQELRGSFGDTEPVENDTYKVLIVGDGKAGKSCMVKRLVNDRFEDTWDSTHGISVVPFDDSKRDAGRQFGFPYKLNLWDFGGQDIYHNTHRMFLQANTTYILLWNAETEYKKQIAQQIGAKTRYWDNKKLPYWLDYIRYLGGGSPVVVAQTHSTPTNRNRHPDESELVNSYEDALDYISPRFLDIDAAVPDMKNSGYKNLLRGLEEAIDSLERVEYLPPHWVTLREKLEALKPDEKAADKAAFLRIEDNTLGIDEFVSMATELGEHNPMALLTNWLVPTGVVFYKEGLFGNRIILNQAWAIRAVYTLYDRSETGYYYDILEDKGQFKGALLDACWHKFGEPERKWFLDFMLKAELCFEITSGQDVPWPERQFVALDMLPPHRPGGITTQEKDWARKKEPLCQLRYSYPFLHTGIIQSFIARTWQLAAVEDIYKHGALVILGDATVCIEAIQEAEGHKGHILVTLPESEVQVVHKIRDAFQHIHDARIYEEAVRPPDGEWVAWEVLMDNHEETHLATADGKHTVEAKPYRVFLPDEQRKMHTRGAGRMPTDAVLEEQLDIKPSLMDIQQKIRTLIANNKVGEALAELATIQPNEAIGLQQQFAQLKSDERLGVKTSGEIDTKRNKIVVAILAYANEIAAESQPAQPDSPTAAAKPASHTATPRREYPKLTDNIVHVNMERQPPNGVDWTQINPIQVLFAAATPMDARQLNTGKESRIKDLIKEFDQDKRMVFQEEHGLGVDRFRWLLFTKDPHIIHFAGHGETEGLVLENDNLDADVLIDLVSNLDNTQIVLLNACYTLPMAQELAKFVPYVIGTQGPIPDDTAIAFARDFYVGLAAGKSVERSFVFGLNGIKSNRLPGADIPVLVIGTTYSPTTQDL